MSKATGFLAKIKKIGKVLGPGLITGASDDDPSGIATYSQAGARFGLKTLWTSLLAFPLRVSIQEMCARIGVVTSVGLTTTLKNHYPKWLLFFVMIFSVPAIILNIGADVTGMAAVSHMMIPAVPPIVFSIGFTLLLLWLIIYLPYDKIVSILKYLCLSVLLYIVVPFFTRPHWNDVFKHLFIPTISFNKEFFSIMVAILGTTISPYLFFWQVTMEAEDVTKARKVVLARRRLMGYDKKQTKRHEKSFIKYLLGKMQLDVNIGILLSTMVMFFIMLATGTALFGNGVHQIDTVEQAAKALEPVAGKASYALFALGVLGTGLLTVPVLSGALSYIVAETFSWKASLDKKYWQVKEFYIVIGLALASALTINFLGVSPIQALYYTAILYGIVSPILIGVILHIGNNKKILKEHTNGKLSNTLGVLTLVLMLSSAAALIYFQFF